MRFPLLNALLQGHLDADGFRARNLAAPEDGGDAVNRDYLDLILANLAWRNPVLETRDSPPVSPQEGDKYLVGESPSGAWSGQAHALVSRENGAWVFLSPAEGYMVWDKDAKALKVFDDGAWSDFLGLADLQDDRVLFGTLQQSADLRWDNDSKTLTVDGSIDAATLDGGEF